MDRYLARYPAAATFAYIGIFVACLLTIVFSVFNATERYQVIAQSADLLARLEDGPRSSDVEHRLSERLMPSGSPFLDGSTATIATAALLQRVLGAVARVGGNVVSSEVVAQDKQSTGSYLKVNISCELKEDDLQPLLYDLEAGMPFLFVNQFSVQVPPPGNEHKAVHVSLEVSGLWSGVK